VACARWGAKCTQLPRKSANRSIRNHKTKSKKIITLSKGSCLGDEILGSKDGPRGGCHGWEGHRLRLVWELLGEPCIHDNR
jgi:hypothetical protein